MEPPSLATIPLACIDAFSAVPFSGNPAAVCLLAQEADENWMQRMAAELNLSETAFLSKRGDNHYGLRWFTPTQEVALCGHATLASAHFLKEQGVVDLTAPILFEGRQHTLKATFHKEAITLDFPLIPTEPSGENRDLLHALGLSDRPVFKAGDDLLVEVESRKILRHLNPTMPLLKKIAMRGVIVTAEGDYESNDFLSRFFAPGVGIDEDPVTGSAHCALAHFWSARLGKRKMKAEQLSPRGGRMALEIVGDRVLLTGEAVTIWSGWTGPPLTGGE